jgi:hypothetical protein
MIKKVLKEPSEKYLFFDFECIINDIHKPNKCVVQDYNGNMNIFDDEISFCRWLFTEKNKGYTVIAHNGKGYDFQFILRYCKNNNMMPKTIYTGNKIMYMHLKALNMKFVDSLSLIPIALKRFPDTFGLTELKKGYFPYFFNKIANMKYKGPLPSKKHFNYNRLKTKDRQEFLKWYNEEKDKYIKNEDWKKMKEKARIEYIRKNPHKVYNFEKNLNEYCISDVDILRQGCIKFRDIIMKISKCDPLQYITRYYHENIRM